MARKLKGLRHMHFTLSKIHSAAGTKAFSRLSAGQKRQWSSQDSKMSRPAVLKAWGQHGRGGSHK